MAPVRSRAQACRVPFPDELARGVAVVVYHRHWPGEFAALALRIPNALGPTAVRAGTTVGAVATAAAAIMDVLGWLILMAALIGTGQAGRFSWPVTLLLTVCFVAIMLFAVRPGLSWWTSRRQSLLSNPVPVAVALAMASAWVTSTLGLQPMFGAFLAGLTMRPRNGVPDTDVLRSLEQAETLLLPLFFVVTGLSLNIGDVRGDALILLVLVFVIASAGKLGPGYAVSRLSGLQPRQSALVAALVNTRGLTD
jgi:Kef-type K+ transport system membrane component KefB